MKKIILWTQTSRIVLFLLTIVGLSACSKNGGKASGDSEKHLTCKLNGQYYKFNYHVNANDKPATDTVHFVVIGGWEKEDMIKGFDIDLTLPDGAKEKTYTSQEPRPFHCMVNIIPRS